MIDPFDQVLAARVKRHEGRRLHPYHDTVGVLTIGYGRNLEAVGISDDEADYMLNNDLVRAYRAARGERYWEQLSDERQRVVVEMVFQLGWHGFLSFRRMRAALAEGKYDQAAEEMLDSKWAQQTPARAAELAEEMRQ